MPLNPNGKLDRRALPKPGQRTTKKAYIAPNSKLEEYICNLFHELTGGNLVSTDDSFFNIGGHSLLAIKLLSKIRKETGKDLTMRSLFEYPTPAELAKLLETDSQPEYSPLFPIRKTGKQPPLFCAHPGGGSGSVYTNLAQALGPDRPVWALQAKGLGEGEKPHETINEMAEEYVKAIQQVQQHGPYHLLGTSLGGVIAQEMACILESQGEKVALLALLDTSAQENINEANKLTDEEKTNGLLKVLAQDLGIDPKNASLDNQELLIAARDGLIKVGVIPADTPISWFVKLLKYSLEASKQLANHKKRSCQASILLFRATHDPAPDDPKTFDWGSFTNGEVFTMEVEAKHSNMLWQPKSVQQITEGLTTYLTNLAEAEKII
jgi:nonribosomal peptide synthetase DhbF